VVQKLHAHPNMPILTNPQHEAFAQARFDGKSLAEAHYGAGYAGDTSTASRVGKLPEIQERIAEFYRERAAATAYEKTNAVRDLLAVVHTCPADADDDNPLCEVHMGKEGPYRRLPGKLQAMARLIKLMGWDRPVEIKVELKNNFLALMERIRRTPCKSGFDDPSTYSDENDSDSESSSPPGSATCLSGDGRELTSGASEPSRIQHQASGDESDSSIEHQATSMENASSAVPPDDSSSSEASEIEPAATSIQPSDTSSIESSPSSGSTFQPSTIPPFQSSLPPRHESFALSRVKGLSVLAAYHAAGYTGDTPNLAWRLNSMPAVQARIAELNGSVSDAVGYHRDDAVRDLICIIRATPSEVGPDHPYCEKRVTSWGTYHRFPSKLTALTLLARILNWNGPTKVEVAHDPDKGFKQLREFISKRS
jgi:hypothetical protein